MLQKLSTVIRMNPTLPVKFITGDPLVCGDKPYVSTSGNFMLDLESVEIKWFCDCRSQHTLINEERELYSSIEGQIAVGDSMEEVMSEVCGDEDTEVIQVILVVLNPNDTDQ